MYLECSIRAICFFFFYLLPRHTPDTLRHWCWCIVLSLTYLCTESNSNRTSATRSPRTPQLCILVCWSRSAFGSQRRPFCFFPELWEISQNRCTSESVANISSTLNTYISRWTFLQDTVLLELSFVLNKSVFGDSPLNMFCSVDSQLTADSLQL